MNSCISEYARQTSLHSQDRSSKSLRRPKENSSIAFTTLRSHDPQLWAPRTIPPAVGWDFTWAFTSRVRSRTSTTDHSQGGRYSPRRKRRSTIVRLWTFTGLKEIVSLCGSASCPDRTASSIASSSVRNAGLPRRSVLSVAPAACARSVARARALSPPTCCTASRTTRAWSRSCSVQVEMYCRGSKSRGRRSSFTSGARRMESRRTRGGGKTFAPSATIPDGGQAEDHPDREEDAREEPESEGHVGSEERSAGRRKGQWKVDEDLVEDEEDHAETDQADPGLWISVPVRCGRGDGRGRPRHRDGGTPDERCTFGPREIRGGVPPTGVAPPSLVLRDPSEGGPAGRARELRSGLRSVGAAGVAIPAVVLGNVRQLKTAPRTRMLDAGGGDRRGLRD